MTSPLLMAISFYPCTRLDTAYLSTTLYSPLPQIWLVPTKIQWFTWRDHALFRSTVFVNSGLALAMVNLSTKFEVAISIHYKDMK